MLHERDKAGQSQDSHGRSRRDGQGHPLKEGVPVPATEGDMQARLARIEAALLLLLPEAERPEAAAAQLLGEATRGGWFTSGEAWGIVRAKAVTAAKDAQPEPDLSIAMRAAGVRSPHGLGRWLASQANVERGPDMRDGVLWRVRGFEPVGPRETA